MGRTLVHAFGDPWVIEGQGTAGIEIAEQLAALGLGGPDHDCLVLRRGRSGLRSSVGLSLTPTLRSLSPKAGTTSSGRLEAGEILPVKDLTHPTYCDALQTPQTYPVQF
jgi:threonine dehydratase